MANQSLGLSDELHAYLLEHYVPETDAQRQLRDATHAIPARGMQISPEQGRFMTVLTRLLGVRRAIEVGTFTGYSALCVALGMPDDGLLIACDISDEHAGLAARHWARAGVADRIEHHIGPGDETLIQLLDDGHEATFDLAFIDADKSGYPRYVELCIDLLRPGGALLIDNVLWAGRISDPADDDPNTLVIRQTNDKVFRDTRLDACILPVGDGLTLARRA